MLSRLLLPCVRQLHQGLAQLPNIPQHAPGEQQVVQREGLLAKGAGSPAINGTHRCRCSPPQPQRAAALPAVRRLLGLPLRRWTVAEDGKQEG